MKKTTLRTESARKQTHIREKERHTSDRNTDKEKTFIQNTYRKDIHTE